MLSRSATTKQKSATEKYANLDINRELNYREKEERNQDSQLNERKSNIWSSIKRKVSMTSLASQTLSSVSTATKRTKKSSFSSLQPEVEQPECENEGKRSTESAPEKGTQTSGLSGLRRAATVSGQPRKHPQRKRETQDDSAIDSNGRNLKKPPSSLVLGFFDPDNGIAIGKYNIAHKSTFSKSEKTKKKKKEECDYFYEPNTALAIGKLDDFGSFPESPLKSPLSRSRTTKHKRLSKSNDNIEDGLPVCESQPKRYIRRRKTPKAETTENTSEKSTSKTNKGAKIRTKYIQMKQSKPFIVLAKISRVCTCRCNKT